METNMHVMTQGFCGDKPVDQQAWNTRMVVQLMNSARGDLMLDRHGNLATRITYDFDTFMALPFDQHRCGNTPLALIGVDGWLMTRYGAQWILENCPPNSKSDTRKLRAIGSEA